MKNFLLIPPDGGDFLSSQEADLSEVLYESLFNKNMFEVFWFSDTNTAELFCNELQSRLLISASEYGILLHFSNRQEDKISLFDERKLDTIAENLEALNVSAGLYLPKEQAWTVIEEFLEMGNVSNQIQWISLTELKAHYPNAEYI